MGDIFDIIFEGGTGNHQGDNMFGHKHLDTEYIDTDLAYDKPPSDRNYNDRLAIGFKMLGEYE